LIIWIYHSTSSTSLPQEAQDKLQFGIMNLELIVIKLGGSVITDDDKFEVFEKSRTKKLIKTIADNSDKYRFVIVHGAGSFGHKHAKKHELSSGFQNKSQLRGFVDTHNSMLKLNSLFLETFTDLNLKPLTFVPLNIFTTNKKRIETAQIDTIEKSLNSAYASAISLFVQPSSTVILSSSDMSPFIKR